MSVRRSSLALVFLGAVALFSGACQSESDSELGPGLGFYALVTAPEGFSFYPPLAPMPVITEAARTDLLASLELRLERTASDGVWIDVARFAPDTRPALALKAQFERYYVLLTPPRISRSARRRTATA
jgi:hypothetical protein